MTNDDSWKIAVYAPLVLAVFGAFYFVQDMFSYVVLTDYDIVGLIGAVLLMGLIYMVAFCGFFILFGFFSLMAAVWVW